MAGISADDSAVDHALCALLLASAGFNVDDAIAHSCKAWIDAKDPQWELAGQGQFEFRAIV